MADAPSPVGDEIMGNSLSIGMVRELTFLRERLPAPLYEALKRPILTVRIKYADSNACAYLSLRWMFSCRASSLRFLNAFWQTEHSCAPLGWSWALSAVCQDRKRDEAATYGVWNECSGHLCRDR